METMNGTIRKFSFKDNVFLNSGHMCGSAQLDMPVLEFREMVYRNLHHMINNPHANPAYKQLRIVFEKDASYSFDMSEDFYEMHCVDRIFVMDDNETYGDMTPFFKTKDMGMHTLPWVIVLSDISAKQTIVWDHTVFDGIVGHIICNTLTDRPIPSYPIPRPSTIELVGAATSCIPYTGNISLPSLLDKSRTNDTTYASNKFEFTKVKSSTKKLGVSIASYAASTYITALFKILPTNVSYLKVAVSYNRPPVEGILNAFGAIPIVVYRNKSSPVDINTLVKDCFYFSYVMEQFICGEKIPLWMKTIVTDMVGYKPDVIFSSMLHDGYDTATRVRSPTTSTVFYACYIDNNIETSCSSSAYDISKIVL
jgi:hypothetical protein